MERDRSQLLEMTTYATSAAAALADLHDEWSALQQAIGSGAARMQAKSETLRTLAGDMERAVDEHLSLTPDSPGDSRLASSLQLATQRRAAPANAGLALQARVASPGRDVRAHAGHARRRARRNDSLAVPRWAAMVGYGLVGAAVAVLLFISVRDLLPARESIVVESVTVEPADALAAGEHGNPVPQEQQSDVARERAALDASPAE
jgi:hypothetical protein